MNPQNNVKSGTPGGLSLPPVNPVPAPVSQDATTTQQPSVPTANTPQPAPAPTTQPQATPDDATPLIADDDDLIEKEWVEKAKALVDQTKNDPYKQNQVMNKFKATYIKKRYNKDIQLRKD